MTEETVENTALVVAIDETRAIAYFKDSEKFDELLANIAETCNNFVADVETKTGRAEITSMAYKVVRTRTTLDKWGKKLNEEKRAEINAVDEVRRDMREKLEALQEKVRKPLNEWEEQEGVRIERIKSRLQLITQNVRIDLSASSQMIAAKIDELNDLALWGEYDEFEEDALAKIEQGLKDQEEAHDAAKLREDQAKELAEANRKMVEAQREANEAHEARLKAEKEAEEAEAARLKAETDAEEAKARAERIHKARERSQAAEKTIADAKAAAAQNQEIIDAAQVPEPEPTQEPVEEVAEEEPKTIPEQSHIRTAKHVLAPADKEAFNEAVSGLYHIFPSMGAGTAKAIIRNIYDGNIKHVAFLKKGG